MHVLISAASKHGATAEIAEAIGTTLKSSGLTASVVDPNDVEDLGAYQAFVLGSAVYAGRWQKSARLFVDRHAAELCKHPVWLFSSGPIGDPPAPTADPVDVSEIMQETGARAHRLLAGRLDQSRLSFGERAIVAALRAEYGDFRDWREIDAWASEIARDLTSQSLPETHTVS